MIRAESRPANHLLLIGQPGAALVELLAQLAALPRLHLGVLGDRRLAARPGRPSAPRAQSRAPPRAPARIGLRAAC